MFKTARIIFLALLPMLVFGFLAVEAGAHEGEAEPYEDIEAATLAPDSPFYFLRGWQEGIERFVANFRGDEAVADLEIRLAERRISEMRRLANLGINGDRMERLRERWEQHLERAEERAERATENREAIRERILEQMDRHRAVFERVREQAPEEARDALDRAIENYETRRGDLLDRFSEDQIEEIREELRERLESTVDRFELRRERFRNSLENGHEETETTEEE